MHLAITVAHPVTNKPTKVDLYDISRTMHDEYKRFRVVGKNVFVKAPSVEAALIKTLKGMPKTMPVSEAIAKLEKVKIGLTLATTQEQLQYARLRDKLQARALKRLNQQIRWAERRKQQLIAQARAVLKRYNAL